VGCIQKQGLDVGIEVDARLHETGDIRRRQAGGRVEEDGSRVIPFQVRIELEFDYDKSCDSRHDGNARYRSIDPQFVEIPGGDAGFADLQLWNTEFEQSVRGIAVRADEEAHPGGRSRLADAGKNDGPLRLGNGEIVFAEVHVVGAGLQVLKTEAPVADDV